MSLYNYLTSEQNIYLAIYSVKSYVFDVQLLNKEDKERLNGLLDPFNQSIIFKTIKDVKKTLERVLQEKDYFFDVSVYFKPKDYVGDKAIFRPIHSAELVQLISMVALMQALIYEIPEDSNGWKLNLSNYSRLIPNNFYGNRVSKKPEELFKKWHLQYKKYTQKANDYFRTFHESKEYKYELKLDLENFFPSVNPIFVYSILMENIPVTLTERADIETLKMLIFKLLNCRVTNLNTEMVKEEYYGVSNINQTYTRGIAQGLPQSYFFGNICMLKIAKIFENVYEGKSVYYVDDSYIYTNESIESQAVFEGQLREINKKIKSLSKKYIDNAKGGYKLLCTKEYDEYSDILETQISDFYNIKVHVQQKSEFTPIHDVQDGELHLKMLSREASQVGRDIFSAYSEEEDITLLSKTKALLTSIETEMSKLGNNERKSYRDKLERYYKFFKYREIKLRLKTNRALTLDIFETLVGNVGDVDVATGYKLLDNNISKKQFFEKYKHDIWEVAVSVLITNTVFKKDHALIKRYITNVIDTVYSNDFKECAYLERMYKLYLEDTEIDYIPDTYMTLNRQVNKKLIHYANLNSKALQSEFAGVKIKGMETDIISSFEICSADFVKISKIVNENSDRMKRMFLNAVYSKIFRVAISDDIVLSSYDKKGLTYGELRLLVFLRNQNCNVDKLLNWDMDLSDSENMQNIDYTIFEVLSAYKKYVNLPENIDNLIRVHKYTCDVWKNGAKHLYFYTLHNQEHAVDLIKNIIKIVKTFSYLKISNYDYYILFIACYLHDISMVRIASANDFLLDTSGEADKIVTSIEHEWYKDNNTAKVKGTIYKAYKQVDEFFENKIRSKHAKESAEEIRKRSDLKFLEASVRESVAAIAEGHMMDTKDIYFVKGDAKNKLISYKFDKILLRFADLLDMSERRVSKPILNHNIDNMSVISAFHWVSHLLTEGYELTAEYDECNGLMPGDIKEKVVLSIYVRLSQFSKYPNGKCIYGKMIDSSLNNKGFSIEVLDNMEACDSEKCNFLCRWFNEKNSYLIQEMQGLEAYLKRVPLKDRFYENKILLKVIVSNPTDLTDDQFDILNKKLSS